MSDRIVPPFHGNINFNAQHSPVGAFMSFTCGHFGTRGGFAAQTGRPGNQDLYIGIKDGDRYSLSPLKCLPFFRGADGNASSAFLVEQSAGPVEQHRKSKAVPYRADQIERHYGWASDTWITDDFEFAIHTPFFPLPEPTNATAIQLSILPAVIAELTVDNTCGTTPRTLLFAINFPEPGARLLDSSKDEFGFAWGRQFGVRAVPTRTRSKPFLMQRWSPDDCLAQAAPHGLGSCPGIGITIAPGERGGLRLVLGCYIDGVVTTGIEGKYLYTRTYGSLNMVLDVALSQFDHLLSQSALLDRRLSVCDLSADQQFLIAHATRSYHGSTQLLDVAGKPFWIVNEGEYCMMNTLDLAVDHVFWELKHNPWVVRNLLDNFVTDYSYHDEVKVYAEGQGAEGEGQAADPDRDPSRPPPGADPAQLARKFELKPGGISFCHDMGAHNNFTPRGHSSYELPNLTGCFSYMTAEQLCNWSLVAATYVLHTNDLAWAKQNRPILAACVSSLLNRGGEAGFAQFDSSRCQRGSEITTYDSLDHSLAQTRNNVYMAVKTWASYLGLALVLEKLNDPAANDARTGMQRIETAMKGRAGADGVIPAVLEKDNPGHASRILPAVEGLLYPLMWKCDQKPAFFDTLKTHALALLTDPQRRNLFSDGGIKLSSTSNNSWMSKIAIFQHIAREILHLDQDPQVRELLAKADAAHVKWQTEGESAYWACSDQMVSGVARASRYYPRIITTALWMK